MINPAALLRLKKGFSTFSLNHPKVMQFFGVMTGRLSEDAIIEVSIQLPDGTSAKTNLRLNQDDMALIEDIKSIMGSSQE